MRRQAIDRGEKRESLVPLDITPTTAMHTWGLEMYFTYEDAAMLCMRSVSRIKHLVSEHKLRRKLVRGPTQNVTYLILLPADTVRFLRNKTLGL